MGDTHHRAAWTQRTQKANIRFVDRSMRRRGHNRLFRSIRLDYNAWLSRRSYSCLH